MSALHLDMRGYPRDLHQQIIHKRPEPMTGL